MGANRPRRRTASRVQLSDAASDPPGGAARRILYGRRQGPKLRADALRLLDGLLPRVTLTLTPNDRLDPFAVFADRPRVVWLEIGFGGGEHLAAQAARRPDVGLIGVEPFINGVAKLLRAVEQGGLGNVRVLMDDARLLLDGLAPATLERVFILFPDPWPKLRHHKRRIVNADTLAACARVLAPGGRLLLATDHADYARWMLAHALRERGLVWTARSARDWREPPADWVATRYETKARAAGRQPVFLEFSRP